MRELIVIMALFLMPSLAKAACPAAPVGSAQDRVIQMVAGGDSQTQMGSDAVVDATEEGVIVYDATNNTLAVCDGANWVQLGGGGGLRTDCAVGNGLRWDGTEWQCSRLTDLCPPNPGPGNEGCEMPDFSIYAGQSPDGNVPMYTTPADAPTVIPWNNGTPAWVDTTMINCTSATPGAQSSCQTGEANTAILVAEDSDSGVAGVQPHQAAAYCDGLTAHGYSDWYLPAQDELNVLFTNRAAIGDFNLSGSFPAGWYWSSSENVNFGARGQMFSDGSQGNGAKRLDFAVRCVRR